MVPIPTLPLVAIEAGQDGLTCKAGCFSWRQSHVSGHTLVLVHVVQERDQYEVRFLRSIAKYPPPPVKKWRGLRKVGITTVAEIRDGGCRDPKGDQA